MALQFLLVHRHFYWMLCFLWHCWFLYYNRLAVAVTLTPKPVPPTLPLVSKPVASSTCIEYELESAYATVLESASSATAIDRYLKQIKIWQAQAKQQQTDHQQQLVQDLQGCIKIMGSCATRTSTHLPKQQVWNQLQSQQYRWNTKVTDTKLI
jgi:hypothetical protein